MRFLASFAIWLFVWLPVALTGICITPVLLLLGWQGYSTWWGNHLYGKAGNAHGGGYVFLAFRNPCSNFGKVTLGVSATAKWPWLVDAGWCKYGWAEEPDSRDGSRKFYFSPFRWLHKK